MSFEIRLDDFSEDVIRRLHDTSVKFLEETGGELEAQTMRNTRVDTGKTRESFKHKVDEKEMECMVGSDFENAIWEEFGTGEYALNGGGRKTKWKYQDAKGDWHTTSGKKPTRAMFKAFQTSKGKIQKHAESLFSGELK